MIEGVPLGVLTPSAIAGLCVVLILTGRLVPRRTYDDKVHEADQWRTECRLKDQTITELNEMNGVMLHELGATMTQFMGSLRQHTELGEVDER